MEPDQEKRHRVIEDFLTRLNEYYAKYEKPLTYQMVSRYFYKRMHPFGGLDRILKELEAEGKIGIELLETAAKVVYPGRLYENEENEDRTRNRSKD